ncbi:MAG: hypothetical protein AAGA43_01850 [Bacteroidota bacterium]
MKRYTFILLTFSILSCSDIQKSNECYTTDYFEFENNYWVNLHHFLYQRADGSQLRKLQHDSLQFIDIGEMAIGKKLSGYEQKLLNEAIAYYKDSIITKTLRRELNAQRSWLQEKEEHQPISDTSFGKNFTETLNKVSPIYRKHFWNVHESHNFSILEQHIETIDAIEEEVIKQMERLSLNQWPDSTKVRVDLTAYANWAGAYTTSIPKMNIIVSTLDPSKTTSSFVETILHEGSHLLYLFDESPIRDKIYYKSEELSMQFPRNLWHASMFYLCGRATQDELSKLGIQHEMIMDVNHIFTSYNTEIFRETNEKYYLGQVQADTLVKHLLIELDKRPKPMGSKK